LLAARTYRHQNHGRAEVELLEAKWHRAAGAPFAESAAVAVRWAKKVDDIELLREAFLVLHHAHRNAGEAGPAAQALAGALRQRQRMLDKLPDELRASYLERSPLKRLAEFEAGVSEAGISETGQCRGDGAPSTRAVRGTKSEPMRTRPNGGIGQLVGSSPAMVTLRAKIARVASTDATVLVHGPTGTGKELVAEAIHAQSQRSQGPLVKVNCAALVETLLLSELFGHEKGAFTGASTRRRGRFELAEGGTLFLDEIGDISERTQVALLRVLQDGTFERVGGCTSHRANVRVVCATHRDLEAMVERGEFRRDLYYRLCGILVAVPALTDHVSDVAELAEVFVRRTSAAAGVSAKPIQKQALAMLAQHPWPGNVRELENAVRVAALFATGQDIAWEDFRANVAGLSCLQPVERMPPVSSRASEQASDSSALVYEEVRAGLGLAAMKKKLERACIARALVDSGGNITRAAGLLGMKRPRLSQLVKQYELGKMLEELKSC
jgi:DNA-binding NtrC family response regulator